MRLNYNEVAQRHVRRHCSILRPKLRHPCLIKRDHREFTKMEIHEIHKHNVYYLYLFHVFPFVFLLMMNGWRGLGCIENTRENVYLRKLFTTFEEGERPADQSADPFSSWKGTNLSLSPNFIHHIFLIKIWWKKQNIINIKTCKIISQNP